MKDHLDEEMLAGYDTFMAVYNMLYERGIYTFGDLRKVLNQPIVDTIQLEKAQQKVIAAQNELIALRNKLNKE